MTGVYLSIIVPFYNEQSNLTQLHSELLLAAKEIKEPVEIMYIDDGSSDDSLPTLLKLLKNHKGKVSIKVIALRRKFGQTAAMAAGIDAAKGKYLAFLDSDLQNDPHDIPLLLKQIQQGHDAVFGWRKDRRDDALRTFLSQMGNWLVRTCFNVPLHDVGCTLRVCERTLFDDVQLYGEMHRVLSVLLFQNSTNSTEVIVNHRPRVHGRSKYNSFRIFKLLIDIMTLKFLSQYATKPGYFFGTPGLMCIVGGIAVLGFRPVAAILLILFGVQFLFMGMLAELLTRAYFEGQDKKIYQVRKLITI